MLEKNNKYNLLKVFFDFPLEEFRLRELSRLSKLSPPSVMNYLKEFESKNLIRKYFRREIPIYIAERDNSEFKEYKKISILYELNKCGLIDFLWSKLSPEVIILYGSFSKGESTDKSDIDLFIIGKEKSLNLTSFEKKFRREIHVICEENIKKISNELKNNLINGIILKGYFKVF